MADPITVGAGAIAAAWVAKDGVQKLLGPTADYLGGELKGLVEKSHKNLASVMEKAVKKSGKKLDQPGVVSPRVLKHVIDEARFSENELFAEYFGGVLASSRTDDGVDDRGAYYAQLVQRMSVYQLRMHYMAYYLMWSLAKGSGMKLNTYDDRSKLRIIVPATVYQHTFKVADGQKEMPYIMHGMAGLSMSELISNDWLFAGPETFAKQGIEVAEHSFYFTPTPIGLELFVWSHGRGEQGIDCFCDDDLVTEDVINIHSVELARLLTEKELKDAR